MERGARIAATVIAGVVAFIAAVVLVIPSGCDDVGGVPSWERCITMLGTPAYSVEDVGLASSWNVVIPFLLGAIAALITWIGTGKRSS